MVVARLEMLNLLFIIGDCRLSAPPFACYCCNRDSIPLLT